MTNDDYSRLKVTPTLPVLNKQRWTGDPVPEGLAGATIVNFGTIPPGGPEVEGGGLVIDYRRPESERTRRVVFAFDEASMWVVYEGELGVDEH
jgi:hypothetical protein